MIAKATSHKILWSTFVQYFGRMLTIVIGVVTLKLVTNYLGAEEYGFYGKISEYSLFFSVAANLGIFGNVVRKMAEKPRDGQLFVNALALRIITAILFLGAGFLYAFIFIPEKSFSLGVLFFMGSLFFDYITTVCTGMLQANYMMGRSVFATVMGRITILVLAFLFIRLTIPAEATFFFLAPLGGSLITMGISLAFVRTKMKFVWKLDHTLIRMIFLTALPFGIINITNNLYFRFMPSFFAAKALTSEQFASYNVSLHIAAVASIFSTFLMFSTLPAFKQALKDGHMQKAKELVQTIKRSFIGLSILMVTTGSLLAPYAIKILTSKEFVITELWFILPGLLLLAAVSYFYDLILLTIFAFEEEIWLLKRELIAVALGATILLTSLLTKDPAASMMLILLGAIAAELLMVILGFRKIQKCFTQG